jgi:hypothetical protein
LYIALVNIGDSELLAQFLILTFVTDY